MTFGGVPILDWVIFAVLLGFGIEAYVAARPSRKRDGHTSSDGGEGERSSDTP